MERKEEIILTTLRLATKYGLSGVSLGQIADSLGIKKPSLYNHFESKEDLINEMYVYLNEQAQKGAAGQSVDFGELVKSKSVNEILLSSAMRYIEVTQDDNLFLFYKLVYQERSMRKEAAQIVMNETKTRILAIKNLFYALQVHGKMYFDNIDVAALSYAMAMHSLIDWHFDSLQVDGIGKIDEIKAYIDWFCKQFAPVKKENV